ncbi:MAG: Ribosomal RNA small subunit methyltransferase H [Phycisphaerae bacterium]|nr:Ribosomal RNA small subunit methyltransferase H [Phycisphaerae bacterium]
MSDHEPQPSDPSRRRPRYRGTHPRRFEERYKERDGERFPGIVDHVRAQGRTPAGSHVPVLLEAVLDRLRPRPGEVVLDGTLGYGGHAQAFLERLAPGGRLIGLDVDAEQLERTRTRMRVPEGATLSCHARNFSGLAGVLRDEGIVAVDAIFLDLGVSSMQIDDPARGFSYKHDGPLDLRLDRRRSVSGTDLVASLAEPELAAAFRELGDEPDADRIARRIVTERRLRPIKTTRALSDLILAVKGVRRSDLKERAALDPHAPHPAARVFQALRMLVNDERAHLAAALRNAAYCLNPGGRIGVLSFHSGEDALVEAAFTQGVALGLYRAASDIPETPTPVERRDNPRCASALFRWAVRAGD